MAKLPPSASVETEVDIEAGFEPTKYEQLIAHSHKLVTCERRKFLIEKVNSFDPF